MSLVLVFLHGVIHQGKVASATTTFVWVWPVVPFIQSDCRILEGINCYLRFLYGDGRQVKLVSKTINLIV